MLACSASASGQDWARKMFQESAHDFGVVARAAKTVYKFEIQNIYEETVHITGVRASCGCTKPSISQATLKTWEKGEIIAEIDTRNFTGQRSATVTVTIDKPYPAEIQLQVFVNIRTDVVINPGVVELGSVDEGTSTAKTVAVNYAGRNDWKITDVRSANEHLQVELQETERGGGRVAYALKILLDESAPPGTIADQLFLVTNDRNYRTIPLDIQGRIVPELTVTPATLVLGDVAQGQEVTEKIVVRGKSPFKILAVECDDASFSFDVGDESKTLQIVTLRYTASSEPGKIRKQVRIVTDRDNREVLLEASATVTESAEESAQVTAASR
jgi:hypothetical protein